MSYIEDRPFEGWFDDIAGAAASPYAHDPIAVLGVTDAQQQAIRMQHETEKVQGQSFRGLGQGVMNPMEAPIMLIGGVIEEIVLPAIFNALYADQKRKAKEAIIMAVKTGIYEAGEALGNAVVHQMMAVAEQGELLARYKNIYGIVKDSTDPNARCRS